MKIGPDHLLVLSTTPSLICVYVGAFRGFGHGAPTAGGGRIVAGLTAIVCNARALELAKLAAHPA